nr:hypothetical protein [Streptomyces sp. 846.5]
MCRTADAGDQAVRGRRRHRALAAGGPGLGSVRDRYPDRLGNGQHQLHRIEGSADGASWSTLADRTGTTDTSQVQAAAFAARTRHLRVTVTGLPSGVWASIRSFESYDRPFTTSLAIPS